MVAGYMHCPTTCYSPELVYQVQLHALSIHAGGEGGGGGGGGGGVVEEKHASGNPGKFPVMNHVGCVSQSGRQPA